MLLRLKNITELMLADVEGVSMNPQYGVTFGHDNRCEILRYRLTVCKAKLIEFRSEKYYETFEEWLKRYEKMMKYNTCIQHEPKYNEDILEMCQFMLSNLLDDIERCSSVKILVKHNSEEYILHKSEVSTSNGYDFTIDLNRLGEMKNVKSTTIRH